MKPDGVGCNSGWPWLCWWALLRVHYTFTWKAICSMTLHFFDLLLQCHCMLVDTFCLSVLVPNCLVFLTCKVYPEGLRSLLLPLLQTGCQVLFSATVDVSEAEHLCSHGTKYAILSLFSPVNMIECWSASTLRAAVVMVLGRNSMCSRCMRCFFKSCLLLVACSMILT